MLRNIEAGLVRLVGWFAHRPRNERQWMAAIIDLAMLVTAVWIAWLLRTGEWNFVGDGPAILVIVSVFFWFPLVFWRRTYASLLRFAGGRTMAGLATTCLLLSIPTVIIFTVFGVQGVPRTMGLLLPIIFLSLLCVSRLAIRFVLTEYVALANSNEARRNVCIYGAGWAGKQLALALRHEPRVRLVGFIAEDDRLGGQLIDGVPVFGSDAIESLVGGMQIDEMLLAVPELSRNRRRQIILAMADLGVHVRTLPSFGDVVDGRVTLSDLRDVEVEELLGRDQVPPRQDLLESTITDKVVMVTGAGGSIGSELAVQIAGLRPRRLILVEISEFGLYSIEQQISWQLQLLDTASDIDLVAELANVTDRHAMKRVMAMHKPDTVFHAAAYKHVPLVEANPIAGIFNNVMGTLHAALAASAVNVKSFVLISTDKAVRPTNIMGASKRVCELVLQAIAAENGTTCFSMVRFGNVLGSSGSVVPLFKQQIAQGGPITLTHRDVTRYFMTIPEAATLVIQAASMASGGEVFVLDMGKSVRIDDLARSMISLSGLSVRDENNPEGDIEIVEVGLRPGEKLYEELLIGNSPRQTEHPRILQAHEHFLEWKQLEPELASLADLLSRGDAGGSIAKVAALVPEYSIVDSSSGDEDAEVTALRAASPPSGKRAVL